MSKLIKPLLLIPQESLIVFNVLFMSKYLAKLLPHMISLFQYENISITYQLRETVLAHTNVWKNGFHSAPDDS